jgi:N-acetylglucosamine-6-phosphate deacetylase
MFQTALCGALIFTGDSILFDHALLLRDDTIVGLAPLASLPRDTRMQNIDGLLAPGFLDLQVNGGGGVLFNAAPTAKAISLIAAAHAGHGTTAILPTFITGTRAGMASAIDAVRSAIDARIPGIAGLHLEGPFLSAVRRGAHDAALIRPMDEADLALLRETGIAHLLLTVAPETVTPSQIASLVAAGVTVSLGHSDADEDTVSMAIDAGATGTTHLFNAMSQMSGRAPGLVGTTLDRGELWAGLIADLHHVDPSMIRIALAAKRGPGRVFLVSDAMPTAGSTLDSFTLGDRTVHRTDGRLTLDDGTLAGADLTLDRAVGTMVASLGLPIEEALRMASLHPARFMGMEQTHGRIEAGRRADLVLLDHDLACIRCWQGGVALGQSSEPASVTVPALSSIARA